MTIPAGFGQATFIFNGSAVPTGAVCTLGFDNNGAYSAGDAATLMQVAWDTNIQPTLTTTCGLLVVEVKLGPDDTGPSGTSPTGDPGGDVGPGSPPSVAYLVTKNTSLGGRRGRGRMFVPGVDETEVTDSGFISAAKRDAVQLGFDNFMAAIVGDNIPPVLLHDPATIWALVNGQPRRVPDPGAPAEPAPTPINSFSVSGTVATQRRRVRR